MHSKECMGMKPLPRARPLTEGRCTPMLVFVGIHIILTCLTHTRDGVFLATALIGELSGRPSTDCTQISSDHSTSVQAAKETTQCLLNSFGLLSWFCDSSTSLEEDAVTVTAAKTVQLPHTHALLRRHGYEAPPEGGTCL